MTEIVACQDPGQNAANRHSISGVTDSVLPHLLPDQRAPGDEPPARPLADSVESRRQDKIPVVLVEDNRADVLIIEEAIALYGLPIDLQVLEDGAQAFEFIERAERDREVLCPRLLVLDLNLPKRSGKEVLQRIRESARCKDIPVLVITSSNSQKDRKSMAELGANHYFCKPSNYDDFLKVGHVLKMLLDQRSV